MISLKASSGTIATLAVGLPGLPLQLLTICSMDLVGSARIISLQFSGIDAA